TTRYAHAGELRDALAALLLAAGIERPAEELASFFADPEGYRDRLRKRLSALLLGRAEEFYAQKKDGRALDCLNRVVALDPEEPRAQVLIDAMSRRKKRAKRNARLGTAALALLALGALGAGGAKLLEAAASGPVPEVVVAPLEPAPEPLAAPTPPEPTPEPVAPPEPAEEPRTLIASPDEARKPPKKLRRIEDAVKPPVRIEPEQFGNVSIKVHPYAPISIDGKVVNPDKPYFEGPLPAGKHKVRIANACCAEWERELEVLPGEMPPIVVKLEPRPALVKIVSPEEVHVMIAGVYRGTSSASERDPIAVPLPDGAYRGRVSVRLYGEGFADQQFDEEFVAGGLKTLKVELPRR
ncbi:MAG: hypothetical protein ACK4N5_12835, partial [Myxococcales bacterium]